MSELAGLGGSADVFLDYKPQGDTLRRFHGSNRFARCIIGPLGSGKTQASIAEVWRRIHAQKPMQVGGRLERVSRWGIIRNTYTDLINTTIKDWREVMAGIEDRGAGRFRSGQNPAFELRYRRSDGSIVRAEVLFLAYDRPEDQRKARGLQVTGLWLNEVKELNQTVVSQLLGRIGRYPAKNQLADYWKGAIADCNAPDADHWLGKQALAEYPDPDFEGWDFFIQPGGVIKQGGRWVPNPAAENARNLDRDYYTRQIATAPSELWIRANLANEFVLYVDGRPVHPDFNPIIHTAEHLEARPGQSLVVGIDFGRTPAASILQQQASGQWWILDELTTTNMGARKFGRALRSFLNECYPGFRIAFFGDPAGDDMAQTDDETPMMMLAESGIDCLPAPTNDFEVRTTALDRLLSELIDGQPAVLVSRRCSTIIKGLTGAYQFRRVQTSGGDRYTDKPEKSPESHAVESVHYGLIGAGVGEIAFENADRQFREIEDDSDFDGWHAQWTGL